MSRKYIQEKDKCKHKNLIGKVRIRRNYPHGIRSKPVCRLKSKYIKCLNCGKTIKVNKYG